MAPAEKLEADHVIAATGYRIDLSRLQFLPEAIRSRLRTVAGSPVVGRDYQSSVAGLYFVGPAVAPTFGPVMRFVFGSVTPRPRSPAIWRASREEGLSLRWQWVGNGWLLREGPGEGAAGPCCCRGET